MIIIEWIKWKWFLFCHDFEIVKLRDGRWCVMMDNSINLSGRLLSKGNAEKFLEDVKSFKEWRKSKTEEGKDFDNPEVKAWMKRQRSKRL